MNHALRLPPEPAAGKKAEMKMVIPGF